VDINLWISKIASCSTLESLNDLKVELLGKSGLITAQLKSLGALDPEERKTKGAQLNAWRDELSQALGLRQDFLESEILSQKLAGERIDVSLPPRQNPLGSVHLISQTLNQIHGYFKSKGFFVAEGPEVEDEFHNFDALNIPAHHPARQSHDTFYLKDQPGQLLRTHTSTVQIRTLKKHKPPIRFVATGRVYRSDDLDATHTPMFHQVEGLVIEPGIHFGHLKATIIDFCRWFFGVDDLPVRFRPSFFPFTEPSAEVDIGCTRKDGKLVIGKGGDWLELLGCGMIHPHVLESCEIDSNKHKGFAFGMGIERLIMVKYGIADIRQLYDGDLRWLKHSGVAFYE
jgi:phenylalanyl-tRNA synthetase alpha chain